MAVNMNGLLTSRVASRFSVLAIIYGPALIFLGLTVLASVYRDIPFSLITRDPAEIFKINPLNGIQSNVGVLVWAAAATICIFSYFILRDNGNGKISPYFFLWSGGITCVLALDDLFVVHEVLARRYLGLNEKIVLLGYGVVFAWYLFNFRKTILSSEYFLLLLAFGFFGLSVLIDIDLAYRWRSDWSFFFEDGFKLLGIVSWSGYLIRTCFQATRPSICNPTFGDIGPSLE